MKTKAKASNSAAVIIHNDGEPGPSRWPAFMAHPDIQQGMIGLPDVIGFVSLTPVEKIVGDPVGFAAVMSQCDQGGFELLNNPIHLVVVRNRPSVAQRYIAHLSMDKSHGWRRLAQSESFVQISAEAGNVMDY